MDVTTYKRLEAPEEWAVEAIDMAGDGSIELALFSGPRAEARARSYADRAYGTALTEAA